MAAKIDSAGAIESASRSCVTNPSRASRSCANVSPASRFRQSEKLQGIFQTIDGLAAMSPFAPGIWDGVDTDDMAQQMVTLSGNPSRLRPKDEVTHLRTDAAKMQERAAALEAAKGASEVARNAAQARATMGAGNGK